MARDVVSDRLPEWKLQAAVAADLDKRVRDGQQFNFAASLEGFVGALSSYQTQIATASGMKRGEPDIRLYFAKGRLVLVELKGKNGKFTDSQKVRIPILRDLGFIVHVVWAETEEDMVAKIGAIVDAELSDPGSSARMASAE